jgi:branched-chain amino acid transport system permease protein
VRKRDIAVDRRAPTNRRYGGGKRNAMFDIGSFVGIGVQGLVVAATLFLVSSGLSIVFGISRISNFAHGSLYMLGAYVGYSIIVRFPATTYGFFAAAFAAAAVIGVLGFFIEVLILRRLYGAPHHLQLIATFGLFLILRDVALIIWGPQELFAPRVPGFRGPVRILGHAFPSYHLLLIAVSFVVLGLLLLLFHCTRWGVLLRAATEDRDMVAALGVDQKWLFTGVFVLSAILAGFAGAMDVPRVPANLGMDISIIIEAFAVVVIGGMGSIIGCFIASLLVGILSALGTLYLPQVSLALVFLLMAVVLVLRPKGFFGKHSGASWEDPGSNAKIIAPEGLRARALWCALLVVLVVAPWAIGNYYLDILTETLILTLFSWSFYFMAGAGGMMSFGQAAFFGVGIYAPALLSKYLGLTMLPGMFAAPIVGGIAAALLGVFAVRLAGIYFAMLTLAFAQIVWSITFQWFQVTNGELGILNLWPDDWARRCNFYYFMVFAITVGGILFLRRVYFSPFGQSLRAARDSELRAEVTGINTKRQKFLAFVLAGMFSAIAGALMLYLKGSAFPTYLDIGASFDVFVMALLGGLNSLNGPIVGAAIYRLLKTGLQTYVDHWNIVLGVILVLLTLFMPRGVSGLIDQFGDLLRRGPRKQAVRVLGE